MKLIAKNCFFILIILIFLIEPSFANTAQSHDVISFKPSPGDLSMVFLGNIFGVVDGVLAGTGSQIVGAMFGIFNAAVLSLGGIFLLYTLMVSTLNTSNDGQLIGQKWSSLWIPLRSAMGVSLLIPKASGYCAMQILVMMIIVQGVGAADTIWSKALSYLNRGGVLVQKQMDAQDSANSGGGVVMNSVMGIVTAQVCMKAFEIQYNNLRNSELAKTSDTSMCNVSAEGSTWYDFCHNEVPDFVNSVDDGLLEKLNTDDPKSPQPGTTVSLPFPYFQDKSNIYSKLNGLCGQLSWTVYVPINNDPTLNYSEKQMLTNSRTIAVSQVYSSLMPFTEQMTRNSPAFNSSIDCASQGCAIDNFAVSFYGYPLTPSNAKGCLGRKTIDVSPESSTACMGWGLVSQGSTLFSGRELQDAVAAYNGIMLPTLTADMLNNSQNQSDYASIRSFIREAQYKGWILSGAYFFRLAILNNYVLQKTSNGGVDSDLNSGLAFWGAVIPKVIESQWNYDAIVKAITPSEPVTGTQPQCLGGNASNEPFCQLDIKGALADIGNLIPGENNFSAVIPTNINTVNVEIPKNFKTGNINVFTYLVNANSLLLPDQKIILDAGLNSADILNFNPSQSAPKLSKMKFSGGRWGIAGAVSGFMWNSLIRPMWNAILAAIMPPIVQLFSIMLSPIIGESAAIFNKALDVMRMEAVNPILAIADMGVKFIMGVGNSYIAVMLYIAPAGLAPPIYALLMMLMPIVTAWMGIMLTVGFSAAFYVPMVPFLIFTFAAIGWFMAVIEGMVAAPIVALGVLHPEGDDAFGKGDAALMLILNMFLRPALMILGYILGIIFSYVGVWVMNAGFNLTLRDITYLSPIKPGDTAPSIVTNKSKSMYGFWTNVMLFYFSILTYTSLYLSIVQNAFSLIHHLPDRTLRWLSGGQREQLGEDSAKNMMKRVKDATDEAASESAGAVAKAQSGMQVVMSGGNMDDGKTDVGEAK